MALIQCPECGKEISDQAASCPHCGYPISSKLENEQNIAAEVRLQGNEDAKSGEPLQKKPGNRKWGIILGAVVVIAAVVLFAVTTSNNKEKEALSCGMALNLAQVKR